MKRFWTKVETVAADDAWSIALDRRALKTPARATLLVPTRALGEAVAAEWRECGDEIDPRAMPLTGLANAAVDRVAPDRAAFARDLARYAEADLLCYRADGPPSLVAHQAATWDPLLGWAQRRFAIEFEVTRGIVHVAQPPATVARLADALLALDEYRLAAMSPLITIGGSLVTALALLECAIVLEEAIAAVSLDERWQLERWGADAEAQAVLDARARDLEAAARFLALLGEKPA